MFFLQKRKMKIIAAILVLSVILLSQGCAAGIHKVGRVPENKLSTPMFTVGIVLDISTGYLLVAEKRNKTLSVVACLSLIICDFELLGEKRLFGGTFGPGSGPWNPIHGLNQPDIPTVKFRSLKEK